jgi:type I restriction enzyme S subunit
MSSKWKPSTVGIFCPFVYGKGLPDRDRKQHGTVPVVSSAGVISRHDKAYVDGPGIVIGRKGTVGSLTLLEKPFWPIDTAFFVRDEPSKRNLHFTYYLLKTLELEGMNTDSAVPGLNRDNAHKLVVTVPPLEDQQRIGAFGKSIDHLIQTLKSQNTALESIAQTLFRSWFVDFDPVHAKLAGNAPEAMSAELAELFPSEFEESELGLIPKGWSVTSFGAAFDIKGGGTPSTKEPSYWDNGTHFWATPKDLSDLKSAVIYRTAYKLTTAGVQKISSKTLPAGTTLMSSRAPVGYLAIAKSPISINQGFIAVPPTEGLPSSFVVNLLLHKMPEIRANAGGTTFAEISKSQFRPIKWVRPSREVLNAFGRIAEPLYAAVHANCLTIDSLTGLRDHILPRLISGKLRIEDAEAAVAAITPSPAKKQGK